MYMSGKLENDVLPASIEILISCMNQTVEETLENSNAQSDVLIVNQTSFEEIKKLHFTDCQNIQHSCKYICSKQVGLSNSRNQAIQEATGDILLLVDDDEELVDNYPQIIAKAFNSHPDADIITFALNYSLKKFPQKEKEIGYLGALKSCSPQIAFRRSSVLSKQILFDPTMGSGSGNGGGEENKFLFDCLKKKLKIYYVPEIIATIHDQESKWFQGFDKKYFFNRGYSTSKILGRPLAWLYALQFSIAKWSIYHKDISLFAALYWQIKGTYRTTQNKDGVI